MTIRLSTSGQSDYRECPQRYQFAKELRRIPVEEPFSTSFGKLNHKALDVWYRGRGIKAAIARLDEEKNLFTRALAQAMIAGYHARYKEPTGVVDVEVDYELDYDGFTHIGRIDLVEEINGEIWVVEHKNTKSALFEGSTYWKKLTLDPQCSNYARACEKKYGRRCAGILYDVLRIPEERPIKATPEHERRLVKTGPRKGELLAGQSMRDETPGEYRDRLIGIIGSDPDAYYQRRIVLRLDHELNRAEQDLRHTALQVLQSQETGLWARNPAACGRYREACSYLPVCEGRAKITDNRFYKDEVRD